MSSISISSGLGARGCTLRPVNVRKYRAGRARFCFVVPLSISPFLHAPPVPGGAIPLLRRSDRVLQERRCEILPSALPRPGEHQPAVAVSCEPDPGSPAVRADALGIHRNHRPGRTILNHDGRRGEPLLPRDEPLAVPHGQNGVVRRSIGRHLFEDRKLPLRLLPLFAKPAQRLAAVRECAHASSPRIRSASSAVRATPVMAPACAHSRSRCAWSSVNCEPGRFTSISKWRPPMVP